jgi:hypothetical protein
VLPLANTIHNWEELEGGNSYGRRRGRAGCVEVAELISVMTRKRPMTTNKDVWVGQGRFKIPHNIYSVALMRKDKH